MRHTISDPRTIAREIPGFFEAVCPQLRAGVVAYMNRTQRSLETPIDELDIDACSLQHAMLFELGFAVGESLLEQKAIDWDYCLEVAVSRQRRHFDAMIPAQVSESDKRVAAIVGENIAAMIGRISESEGRRAHCRPPIHGLQWISSGAGDFSVGSRLIEVKCSRRNFAAADYRQIVTYWLLSYAAELEGRGKEWQSGTLLNPRTGMVVDIDFSEFLRMIASGRTKVEVLQLFISMIGARNERP